MLKWLLLTPLALGLLALLAAQVGLLRGQAPDNLGLREGKFKPPAKTPNSVSSQADLWPEHPQRDYARIAPLALVGDGAATLTRIQDVVRGMRGAQVVKADGDYLYATFSTALMKYTDDVEFWFDRNAAVVQVRSASRLGRKDFGVNRARVEAIRQALKPG